MNGWSFQLPYAVPYSMCKCMVDRFTQVASIGGLLSFIIHQSRRHHAASRCIVTNNVMFRIKEEGNKVDRRYIPVSPRLVWTSWVLLRVQIVLGIRSCIIRSAGNLSQNYIFRTIDRTIFRKAVEFSFHVDQCFFSVRSRKEGSQDQLYKVSIYPTCLTS